MKKLSDLNPGDKAIVKRLCNMTTHLKQCILSLGITPGVAIKILRKNHFDGLIAVLVRDCRIMMRFDEAALILISENLTC